MTALTAELDLGAGHRARLIRPRLDARPVGVVDLHTAPGGRPCGCSLPLTDAPEAWRTQSDGSVHPGWRAVSLVPLTLVPSVVCLRCGAHGFILEGRWIAA